MKKIILVLIALAFVLTGCAKDEFESMNGSYTSSKTILYLQGKKFDMTSQVDPTYFKIENGKKIVYSNKLVGDNEGELTDCSVDGDKKACIIKWTNCTDDFIGQNDDYIHHLEYDKTNENKIVYWYTTDNASSPESSKILGTYVEATK